MYAILYTFFYLRVKIKIMEWEVMIKCIKTIKEKSRFALLYQITNGECKKETDNSSYFMAQTKIGYPVWVWTKNNISKNKIKEVQDKMKHFIIDNEKVNFTCKKLFFVLH